MITRVAFLLLMAGFAAQAAGHSGTVRFGGLPLPGASVVATRDGKRFTAVADTAGQYSFPGLDNGAWTVSVLMQCFVPQQRSIEVSATAPAALWDLELLPRDEVRARAPEPAVPQAPAAPFRHAEVAASAEVRQLAADPNAQTREMQYNAADAYLINGDVNNSINSPFAQSPAFGNFRRIGSPYHLSLGIDMDLSALDARPYSLAGRDLPYATHNLLTGSVSFGGPLGPSRGAPSFFLSYERRRNRTASTGTGNVPTAAMRSGDFSGRPLPVLDPASGIPFAGNRIPQSQISPQAQSLLALYPMPNIDALGWNYEVPLLASTHADALRATLFKTVNARNSLSANASLDSTRGDSTRLLGFLDTNRAHGVQAMAGWGHTTESRLNTTLNVSLSRRTNRALPFFARRENISGNAGISGNSQDPDDWGPPGLSFATGISPLNDVPYSSRRTQTIAISLTAALSRRGHAMRFGAGYGHTQINLFSQQNARGQFVFDGTATGYDFAGFLLGIPDGSSIAFGNGDKYFRSSTANAFFADDWHLLPLLTVNAGLRWEYSSPVTEKYGRLSNLDVAPGFTAATPVLAASPTGALTGAPYPDALLRPYWHMIEPRVGIAWTPPAAPQVVIRAGYGIYADTGVYDSIVADMAQQPPLSRNLSVRNSAAQPLTLANGFPAPAGHALGTFAVDPGFRPGYAQNWQVSVQGSLRWGLVATAEYLGIKGTHAQQSIYPNTYPAGSTAVCPACPSGFEYLSSGGSSSRHAAQFQLRRRLHSGLAASVRYTWSKAIDNAALGGGAQSALVAQNWLDLRSERALSSFDQRHLAIAWLQYSTGMGIRGGTLLDGWRGALLRDWTVSSQITAGSGMPLTPIYPSLVGPTAFSGNLRPDYTGVPLYAAPTGLAMNPASFAPPRAGFWGNAGRNTITGPGQFSWNSSLSRSFGLRGRGKVELSVEAANLINHVTFTRWDTTLTSATFGLPIAANAMRALTAHLRMSF